MPRTLPSKPNLDSLKYQAKQLLQAHRRGEREVFPILKAHPRFIGHSIDVVMKASMNVQEAQHALALDYGYPHWQALLERTQVEAALPSRLREEDLRTFAEWGLVKVKNLIPSALALTAADYIYTRLSRAGLWADGRWTVDKPEVDAGWVVRDKRQKKALSGVSSSGLFKELLTPGVLAIARQLVGGEELTPTPPHMQFLFTPPNAHQWRLPHTMWHVDYPRTGDLGWAGVQMFTFLQTLKPGGGGSVEVAGSHRLLNDAGIIAAKTVRRRLAREEYFRALMDKDNSDRQRFLDEVGYINDVPLKVVELTGAPGDVYFADLRLLHSLAPNTSNVPRMMVTQRLPRASVAEQMPDVYATVHRQRQARRERRGKEQGAQVAFEDFAANT